MEWIERERENYEARLEALGDICVDLCDICGNEMYHGEEAYTIPDERILICEDCQFDERNKERPHDTKCCRCGQAYWIEKNGDIDGSDMIEVNGKYYCEDCFNHIELCATDDDINNAHYTRTIDL